jgi:hypothetical protein
LYVVTLTEYNNSSLKSGFIAAQAAHCVAGATVKWSLPLLQTIVLLDGFNSIERFSLQLDVEALFEWIEPDFRVDSELVPMFTSFACKPGSSIPRSILSLPLLFSRGGESI